MLKASLAFILVANITSVSVIFLTMMIVRTVSESELDMDYDTSACAEQSTCTDCIKLPQCVYCIDANFTEDKPRCMLR